MKAELFDKSVCMLTKLCKKRDETGMRRYRETEMRRHRKTWRGRDTQKQEDFLRKRRKYTDITGGVFLSASLPSFSSSCSVHFLLVAEESLSRYISCLPLQSNDKRDEKTGETVRDKIQSKEEGVKGGNEDRPDE